MHHAKLTVIVTCIITVMGMGMGIGTPKASAQTSAPSAPLPPVIESDNYINGQELIPLTGETLKQAFAGKTHFGTYKEKRERTGTNQFSETTHADGTTDYKEGDMELKGIWRVMKDRICYKYDGNQVSGVHCFRIYEVGTCFYGYNPAVTTRKGPINANYWSVKSLQKGDISTCDDLIG